MAQPKASHDPTTRPCKYWQAGRPCYAGVSSAGCRWYHDPAYENKNICHKWQRYDCKHGPNCFFLHKVPGGPRVGCEPGYVDHSADVADPPEPTCDIEIEYGRVIAKHVMALVELQMKRDRAEIPDEEARNKKFKHVYQRCFHPDKMGQVGTLSHAANEISKAIMNKKNSYLGPELPCVR